MRDPLFALGVRRTREIVVEAIVPMFAAGLGWWTASVFLGELTPSRPMSVLEVAAILGAVAALQGWYVGRQLHLLNRRRPRTTVFTTWLVVALSTWALSRSVAWGYAGECQELGGRWVETQPLHGWWSSVCQVGAVSSNVYLPGTLLRPSWDGAVGPYLGSWLLLAGMMAAVGLRDLRLAPTRLGLVTHEMLQLAPAAGAKAAWGQKPGEAGVQACGNPTIWGEPCGQLYSAEKVFEPGEWCVRCCQVYTRSERELRFTVVSLFTADVDVLNGLERMDAVTWPQGAPMPPDARLSGQERWVRMGTIALPDVISVATALSLVLDRVADWSKDAQAGTETAYDLAKNRASRLSAWFWFGSHDRSLTYARPTHRVVLGCGPTRLRDLMLDAGEELVLQLDIGLLPVELRTGFKQTFLDPNREAERNNTKQDLWIPVAPTRSDTSGTWVPRLAGDSLRVWLSLDRLRPTEARGVAVPLPYVMAGAEAPKTRDALAPGSLDLVRMPLESGRADPLLVERPGASIADWQWIEWKHLELLRQESLVLVTR